MTTKIEYYQLYVCMYVCIWGVPGLNRQTLDVNLRS